MNAVWYEVNELRKAKPCPMHSRDFWSSMPASLYVAADPKETAELFRTIQTATLSGFTDTRKVFPSTSRLANETAPARLVALLI